MSDSPLISIIMPAYNAARYIREAVESVVAQSWRHWELIIINDGSADNTARILREFRDDRIRILDQDNEGVSAARNVGLEYARGEYVTFLDSDDVLPPGSLEARAAFLMRRPDVDIVDGNITAMDEQLEKVIRLYRPYYAGMLLPRLLALDGRVFFGPFYMVRAALLPGSLFARGMSHAEDLLFFTLLAGRKALRYGFVNEEIYCYRTRDDSAMSDIVGLQQGYLEFMRAVFAKLDIGYFQRVFLRAKIAKIMFLTWLSRREYRRAMESAVQSLFS